MESEVQRSEILRFLHLSPSLRPKTASRRTITYAKFFAFILLSVEPMKLSTLAKLSFTREFSADPDRFAGKVRASERTGFRPYHQKFRDTLSQ